ncbi:hypothetical protein HMI56_007197 [Coelomomyces lativittatus]|nr:hypothetical protein HMI56_007197 [Coelomomyces lativittatus]
MLSASTVLSAPSSDDHHFFQDLQDRIEKNLDVGEMIRYKLVIRDHPPFALIKNKQECLINVPLPVNYFLYSDSTWRNWLTQAILYTLRSEYSLSPSLEGRENYLSFRIRIFLLLYNFFYQLNCLIAGIMIQDLFWFFHNALESINHQLYPRREATLYSYEIKSYQNQMFYYDDGHDRASLLDNYDLAPDSNHLDPPTPPSRPLMICEGLQSHDTSSTRAKQVSTTSSSSS